MIPPEQRFVEKVCEFCELFKQVLEQAQAEGLDTPASPFIMDIVKSFIKKEDPHKAITTFILRSYKSWESAQLREKDYFRSDALSFFQGIPSTSVDSFNGLFDMKRKNGELLIDDNLQTSMWEFFDVLIKTSIIYVHQQRIPDVETKKYTKAFFPEIKVRDMVQKFQIETLE
jgi:hypothetical protein